jgi:hypothetical protein
MKKITLFALLLVGSFAFAQSVNDYEYVIVPSRFDFSNKKDEFRLNTLTKLLLEKYGFKAFLDSDAQPDAIVDSNCKKLFADAESKGSLFKTKIRIILKDCKGRVLFTSDEGVSIEKDWAKAYNQAIRLAFESFSTLNYKYKPANAKISTAQPVQQTAVLDEKFETTSQTLFAQPAANGFQLVDTTPKVVMKLFRTSDANRFTAVKGEQQGDLIARNGKWFFEYFKNDQLVSEVVDVKF